MGILIPVLLISISSFIIWKTSKSFEIASNYLGRNLPLGIKGSTINAIASSMPELLTSLFFLFYINDANSFSGSIGVTAGSAIYNIVIIPALVIIVVLLNNKNAKIELSKKVLFREGFTLVVAEIILIYLINQNVLTWIHGATLVFIYLVYIAYNYGLIIRNKRKGIKKEVNEEDYLNTPSENTNLFYHIVNIHIDELILGKKRINNKSAWTIIALSTLMMSLGSLILVQATEWLGNETYTLPMFGELKGLNIPLIFVAVILSSIASSLPDTIISIRDANNGNYDDSLSNVMGSNTFDISFALGLPLLLYTIIYEPIVMDTEIIEFGVELWIILLLTTIFSLIVYSVGKYLTVFKSIVLILTYLIFTFFILSLSVQFEPVVDFADWFFAKLHIMFK